MNITMERFHIDDYEVIASAFMRDVLNIDFGSIFVSDDADLKDFCFSGAMPEGYLDPKKYTLNELYSRWDEWVIQRVKAVYGITLESTKVSLLRLFQQIEQEFNPTVH